ncbi:hypothetical protein [Burkholderia multivorans]|uniref:hypothetical protein n=2 Tax=Burkholderia multivorans TaxID=87883 RepID=UPI0035BE518A
MNEIVRSDARAVGQISMAKASCDPEYRRRDCRVIACRLRSSGTETEAHPQRVCAREAPMRLVDRRSDVCGACSENRPIRAALDAYCGDFIVEDRIRAGDLVELLPHLRGRTRPFSVIYAPHRRLSAASRSLIDMLTMSTAEA